jgi:pantothenate synthetase
MTSRNDYLRDKQNQLAESLDTIEKMYQAFISSGNELAKTKAGKEFFLLAKKIFYNPNEIARDRFDSNNPLLLAKLTGEDYILRKCILNFINNEEL